MNLLIIYKLLLSTKEVLILIISFVKHGSNKINFKVS